jgi:putative tryptophan/tyrosine transport system substrate-binding protein
VTGSPVHRRSFLTLFGAAAAWPLTARAQQARKDWRVGFLSPLQRPVSIASSASGGFLRGMRELGYVEDKDFTVEWRFAEGRPELYESLAAELVRANVNVIVLAGMALVPAVRRVSTSIPVVMGHSTDPVGRGFVASLARPGGNITGLASSEEDTLAKQVQLLLQALPSLRRIGFARFGDTTGAGSQPAKQKIVQEAVEMSGRVLVPVVMERSEDIALAFARLAQEKAEAVIVPNSPPAVEHQQRLAEVALQNRLPTMFGLRDFVEAGGLMSYGESLSDFFRRAAFYVDKILKGAKPADLPVQQPTRFFLTINRRTADALGLIIPLELLVLADEIIE